LGPPSSPVSQSWISPVHSTYLAISLVYTRQIDLGGEGDLGRHVGVLRATVDLDTVDAILVDTLSFVRRRLNLNSAYTYVWRTKNGTIPIRHHQVVAVVESI
jgi:hypothetical protein